MCVCVCVCVRTHPRSTRTLSLIHPTRVLSVSPRASWQMVMLWAITLLHGRERECVREREKNKMPKTTFELLKDPAVMEQH